MDRLSAFKIYLAVRLVFLHGATAIILEGKYPRNWKDKLPARKDFKLIDFLIDLVDSKRDLLRLCVGNFLYGNINFLYSEQHTKRLMFNHQEFVKNQDRYLQDEIDLIQLRLYNFGSAKGYLSNNKLLDDVFSRTVHIETLCLIYLVDKEFLPQGGYMFDDLINRIKYGSVFFELTENQKNLILKYIVSSN